MPLEHSPNLKRRNDEEDHSGSFHGFNESDVGATAVTFSKELAAVFRQRNQIRQKVVRIQTSLRAEHDIGLAQMNVMSKNLAAAYTEFSSFHSKVMALVSDHEVVEQEEIYENFENLYNSVSMIVEEMILIAKNDVASSPTVNQPQIIIQQQPLKAPIPTFDGSYSAWPKFKITFQDLMARSGDTEAIKLYHLDKALIGSAVGVLDEKIMSEGNYNQAWAILTERYENQRVIVETHIRGLLSLHKMSTESFKDLRNLLDESTRHVESLRYLQQELTGVSEHMVVYLIVNALDRSTRKAWESSLKKAELPKYEPTIAFLKSRCQILENCEIASQPSVFQSKSKIIPPPVKMPTIRSHTAVKKPSEMNTTANACVFCAGQHLNFQCNKLNELSAAQKIEKVRALGICFNCLRKGHRSKDCPSSKTCRKCQKRHHTQLHDDAEAVNRNVNVSIPKEPEPQAATQTSVTSEELSVSTTCSCHCTHAMKTVMLLTAIVHVYDRNNQPHQCRVLLDSGSQVNFISEQMANQLAIPKKSANIQITGINALRSLARDKITVNFRSRNSEYQNEIECLITPKVTGTIPTTKIDTTHWNIPKGFALADPEFHLPAKIDLLIGAELFFELMKSGQINLADNLPQLRETYLGWVVAGVVSIPSSENLQHSNLASIDDVEDWMHRFWEIEEVPNVSQHSTEQQSCEEHFVANCKRDDSGRFIVKLPFKENVSELDDCRTLALKRFLALEKRFSRDPALRSQYQEFIREYETLGHCREVDPALYSKNKYFLPHHAVLRPSSSSTKCRVVFDASAKSSPTSLSLNDVLKIGPVVQSDLFSIMLRFRKYRYVFSADIAKMYRQILVAPEDRSYQLIFWRENSTDPLRVLQLNTITYGTASASFQATRCLIKLAEDEADDTPSAARVLREDFYMDDALSGADTINEAVEIQHQLQTLLKKGGFTIHKWCSNSDRILTNIPEECREKQMPVPEYGANEVIKLLVLLWDPREDLFLIANPPAEHSTSEIVTKRIIYSEVSKLFDPLGIIAPVIVTAKLLVQQLWKAKIEWDEPVNNECLQQWMELKKGLPLLTCINVPRRVTFDNVKSYSLHGFADASSVAYGACIYLRNEYYDGSAKLRLLSSKSKVAPLHELSIPRKELCAALLLTRLLQKVIPALKMELREVVLWSDSTIVLSWMNKPLDQLQQFVRNRIAEIRNYTAEYQWNFIRSLSNPADIVSRGQLPEALSQNRLWWKGPTFLKDQQYQINKLQPIPDKFLPELKVIAATSSIGAESFAFMYKYNDFRKLQRIMANILRFVDNCRKKNLLNRVTSYHHTINELRRATEKIIWFLQHVYLKDEIRRVVSNQPCKRIGNLRPIYHDGLLRVGGRLNNSALPFAYKHQIILPNKNPITKAFIRMMHVELLHIGQTGLINTIQQRYWLLNARSTIRQVTRGCVRCFRTNPADTRQIMGNLPVSRVVPSPPFAVTGVDYAGPFWIKEGTRRPRLIKAYVAVYVCMCTKAVHLEAVSSLTTDAFIASLKRLIGRRGLIQQLHSDNATNFRGAHNELHEIYRLFNNQQACSRIQQFCQQREIDWHFIPPDAPEFGGLWEAAVKSTKTILKKIAGNAKLSFEELATVLIEIEAVLNSRPLFTVSRDAADSQVITPAHYLIGRPLIALAEPSLENIEATRLDRWQHLQLMREHFWRAWTRDYLNTLQPRKKNLRTMPNIRPGMIVILHDKNQPPLSWKLGRITGVFPGDDGLVRAVDVFADGSTYRRSINKIAVLPIEDNVTPSEVFNSRKCR